MLSAPKPFKQNVKHLACNFPHIKVTSPVREPHVYPSSILSIIFYRLMFYFHVYKKVSGAKPKFIVY